MTVWVEPEEPRHPLTGIVHALGMAEARPVLVCAADMPFVTAAAGPARSRAPIPAARPRSWRRAAGELQPLLGCYQPAALEPLARRARAESPLREAVAALGAATYEVADRDLLFNVNTPDDLLQASAMLDRARARRRRPGYPNVKS